MNSFNISFGEIESEEKLAQLKWFCPPEKRLFSKAGLVVSTTGNTDFWSKTHYDFIHDNGHFYYTGNPKNQYDQAGLMVRINENCWAKTSIEFENDPEPCKLGSVFTNFGYSDWSIKEVLPVLAKGKNCFKLKKVGNDIEVYFKPKESENWEILRIGHLHLENIEELKIQVGLYCCSPIDSGFEVTFDDLNLKIENTDSNNEQKRNIEKITSNVTEPKKKKRHRKKLLG